ncbi:hypothetical protein KY285_020833 [Solanum tuberosum]|nr:hypothetical protein KY285_020833 [Solanum tuberosum]
MGPFEIVLGKQPMTPLNVVKSKNQGKCLAAYRVERDRLEMFSKAQDSLRKAQRCMKKYANQHRRSVEFSVGDKVLLKLTPQIWKQIKQIEAPPSIPTQFDAEIEKILNHRVVGTSNKNTKTEFLIHWKDKSVADTIWGKAKDLWHGKDLGMGLGMYVGKIVQQRFKVLGCWQGSLDVQGVRVGRVVARQGNVLT